MSKYNKKIVKRICDLLEKDSFTIPEICAKVGISESIYYKWREDKVEFLEAIEKAKDKFKDYLVDSAKNSLLKKVNGYEVEEKHIIMIEGKPDANGNAKPKIKEQKTIKKHYSPDTTAIIFALSNLDPDNFKNRQTTELTGKNGKDLFQEIDLSKLSDSELLEYHKLLNKAKQSDGK